MNIIIDQIDAFNIILAISILMGFLIIRFFFIDKKQHKLHEDIIKLNMCILTETVKLKEENERLKKELENSKIKIP